MLFYFLFLNEYRAIQFLLYLGAGKGPDGKLDDLVITSGLLSYNTDIIGLFIEHPDVDIDTFTLDGERTIIIYYIAVGNVEIIEFLIKKKVYLNFMIDKSYTPLTLANMFRNCCSNDSECFAKFSTILTMLRKNGAVGLYNDI